MGDSYCWCSRVEVNITCDFSVLDSFVQLLVVNYNMKHELEVLFIVYLLIHGSNVPKVTDFVFLKFHVNHNSSLCHLLTIQLFCSQQMYNATHVQIKTVTSSTDLPCI